MSILAIVGLALVVVGAVVLVTQSLVAGAVIVFVGLVVLAASRNGIAF